jgi:hypothetical protein
MDGDMELRDFLEVEPLTAIPVTFPQQRARVVRILRKWQRSLFPETGSPGQRGGFAESRGRDEFP